MTLPVLSVILHLKSLHSFVVFTHHSQWLLVILITFVLGVNSERLNTARMDAYIAYTWVFIDVLKHKLQSAARAVNMKLRERGDSSNIKSDGQKVQVVPVSVNTAVL